MSTSSSAPQPSPSAPLGWPVWLVCALIPLAFTAVLLTWYPRTGPGFHVAGLFQGDMPTYLCNARSAARSPTWVSYANPWDLRQPPKALLVQWPISLMAGLLWVGLSPAVVEQLLRLVGGFAMYVLLACILRRLFVRPLWFWSAFLTLGLGAGCAWAMALSRHPTLDEMPDVITSIERSYYWWFADLYRNLEYPLETLQHCVVFAYLLAVMRRRMGWAVVCLALAATSSPFVTVMLFGIHTVCVLPGFRQHLRTHVAALFVGGLFVFHYAVLTPHDPVLGAVAAQHQSAARYQVALDWRETWLAHGLALAAFPALVLDGRFRRKVLTSSATLPFVAMAVWTFLLIHHTRFPISLQVMPKHFLRGYPFMAAWVLTWLWLQDLSPRGNPARHLLAGLALLIPVFTLPDNIAFTVGQYRHAPSTPLLVWPVATEEMLGSLRGLPGRLRVLAEDSVVNRQICSMTNHASVLSTDVMTPNFPQRIRDIQRFLDQPDAAGRLEDAEIGAVVLPRGAGEHARLLLATGTWRVHMQNSAWTVLARGGG